MNNDARKNPPVRFHGLDSCKDMLEKLRWDATQMDAMELSAYSTFNFVVTAYHLYKDWVKESGDEGMKARKAALPPKQRTVMQVLADLANGNKHFALKSELSKKNQVVTEVSRPMVGDWWTWFSGHDAIYIYFAGYDFNNGELRDHALRILEWIVEGDGAPFPEALEENLERHRIKQRDDFPDGIAPQ